MSNHEHIKICALTTISKTMDWFIVDSMRNLAEHGYEITLICNMDESFEKRNADYAMCIHLPMSRGASIVDLLRMPFKLKSIFRKNHFDIIYYTSPNASFYAALGGKMAGINKRVYSQCGLRYVSFSGWKRILFRTIEKITCQFSTHIRAQSPLNMQFAIDEKLCTKEKVSVVGIGGTTGVDLSQCDSFDHEISKTELRKKYEISQDSFLFGYVGRINKDKGINELIEAFMMLSEKHSDIYLSLVGMIDSTNPISDQNLKIIHENDHIIYTGNVPPDEVYAHMTMFDVLTHPTYREGFGKVLQEAMGVGLPIITTNVPGPSEVVENSISGVLVEAKNADDLAAKMEMLYLNPEYRNQIAQNGRKRAEKFFDRPIMLENTRRDLDRIMEKK